ERLISFVDMADALFFLIDEDAQPAVHRLFDKLADFYDGLFKHLSESIKPDLIWFHDDWGSQRAPLFSLDLCREMLVPYIKRVVDSAHKYGMGFEFHSCGHLELLVPAMIEAGCDIWQGQSMNDKAKLFREYGDDIKMSVGFPTLPEDATEAQIDDAVGAFLDTFPYNVYCELTMVGTPGVYAKVYEESRKRLSK
ncbi:MAG: hypothetical protein HUJ75_04035, partial [Parasporobacterium sp.]|nr:hypothetical protein [Parasporobacterium sp.]